MKRIRRSLLYIPGNNPALVRGAALYQPDVLVFDLEDSVALAEKDSARILVRNALQHIDLINPYECEVMVRINDPKTEFGHADLEMIVKEEIDSIRLPKAETEDDVKNLDNMLTTLEEKYGKDVGKIEIIPILESVKGVEHAEKIAACSERVTGLTLGAEDFTRDLGASRTKEGEELRYARGKIVLAAKYAGVHAIDTIFGDVNDEEGLVKETKYVKSVGFDGKSAIHPRQIGLIHQVFNPTQAEIEHALKVRIAAKEAEKKGSGVIALDGRMIDAPVLKRAEKILNIAERLDLIEAE